eukprot:3941537-Rhodomonas_salina.3
MPGIECRCVALKVRTMLVHAMADAAAATRNTIGQDRSAPNAGAAGWWAQDRARDSVRVKGEPRGAGAGDDHDGVGASMMMGTKQSEAQAQAEPGSNTRRDGYGRLGEDGTGARREETTRQDSADVEGIEAGMQTQGAMLMAEQERSRGGGMQAQNQHRVEEMWIADMETATAVMSLLVAVWIRPGVVSGALVA